MSRLFEVTRLVRAESCSARKARVVAVRRGLDAMKGSFILPTGCDGATGAAGMAMWQSGFIVAHL